MNTRNCRNCTFAMQHLATSKQFSRLLCGIFLLFRKAPHNKGTFLQKVYEKSLKLEKFSLKLPTNQQARIFAHPKQILLQAVSSKQVLCLGNMPRIVKAVVASKSAKQKEHTSDDEEALVTPGTNGFVNGGEVKKSGAGEAKARGRNAKQETPAVRGRKKAVDVEKLVQPAEDIVEEKKPTAKGRSKKFTAVEDVAETQITSGNKAKFVREAKGKKAAKKPEVSVEESVEHVTGEPLADIVQDIVAKKGATGKGRKKPASKAVPMVTTDNGVDTSPVEKAVPAKKRAAKKDALAGENDEEMIKMSAAKNPIKSAKKDKTPTIAAKQRGASATPEKPAVKRKAITETIESVKAEQQEDVEITTTTPKKKAKKDAAKSESSKPVTARKAKTAKGKNAEKATQDIVEQESEVADVAEKKPRARKRAATTAAADNATSTVGVDGSKPSKGKKTAAPLNATTTTYNKADFALAPSTDGQPRYNLKISSWNVAGLRSWLKKDGLRFLEYEEPDIFCLQEIKCTTDQLPEEAARIPGYHPYWLCMPGGYAGVAIYSKIMPINVEYGIGSADFDDVGRIISAEYEKFYLVNVYVPNSGRKLVNLEPRMRWEKLFQAFVQKLDARKPVVICGDMNVSHLEIDLANPKANTRNAGFTKEERDQMTALLALGYVDTFRHLYPQRTGAYTFWTYMGNARARNVGWRLDYFIVSERFNKRVVDNCMRTQVLGSDHCPITLFLKL